ncbi:winged helix DNA-binding protein [Methanotrichaceae archaeon M04Ac]|uniref:Winged helix DNA-binding protein n=1 Tax=Candidatus Methanocrinis alkalitolerans TaxID=3033395 RepID=A0ABT5XCK6_9EURY|nr:winged helix DNA-binding protein [Candidatus Methanocrinis alkalitolerans]MDF0592443.1 winged helix DNA-binding protein [Candidatus Methanocrinis alkalitolerans]
MNVDEIERWVLSADRRLLLMRAIRNSRVVKASEVARRTDRSIQNISRAIKECEELELVECITPEKHTWKKYMLTDQGHHVLRELERHKMI